METKNYVDNVRKALWKFWKLPQKVRKAQAHRGTDIVEKGVDNVNNSE